MSHGARLASLAILRTNWDTHGRSWLDSFGPFVAESLRQSSAAEVGKADIQQALGSHFGIDIPTGALRTILRRAAKHGLVVQKNHRYHLVREALNSQDLRGQRRDAYTVLQRARGPADPPVVEPLKEQVETESTGGGGPAATSYPGS